MTTKTETTTTVDSADLDRRFRDVMARVTPETSLQCAQELADLGIGPRAAFLMVSLAVLDDVSADLAALAAPPAPTPCCPGGNMDEPHDCHKADPLDPAHQPTPDARAVAEQIAVALGHHDACTHLKNFAAVCDCVRGLILERIAAALTTARETARAEGDATGYARGKAEGESALAHATRTINGNALVAVEIAEERNRLILERDSAREQFDRHVAWASEQVATARAEGKADGLREAAKLYENAQCIRCEAHLDEPQRAEEPGR